MFNNQWFVISEASVQSSYEPLKCVLITFKTAYCVSRYKLTHKVQLFSSFNMGKICFPIQNNQSNKYLWDFYFIKVALSWMTVLKSFSLIFFNYVNCNPSQFYIQSHSWFLFFAQYITYLWRFSILVDYYLTFSFDLKAILLFAKLDFIDGNWAILPNDNCTEADCDAEDICSLLFFRMRLTKPRSHSRERVGMTLESVTLVNRRSREAKMCLILRCKKWTVLNVVSSRPGVLNNPNNMKFCYGF